MGIYRVMRSRRSERCLPDKDIHVLPINDLRDHVESEDCWCEPRIEGEGPTFVIVHHSADKREFSEGESND